MFNIFKKQPQQKEVAVMDYPEIIHTIHREFNTAGENILREAQAILADCKLKDKEKGKLLHALGFKNTPQAKEVVEIEQKEKQAEINAKLVNYYSEKYPLNKFITEDIVKNICEKYGLVYGEVSLYKGFVPKDKLKQIQNFKANNKDILCHEKSVSTYGSNKGEVSDDSGRCAKIYPSIYKKLIEPASLKICAPLKDMETRGYDMRGHHLVKHIPDPVVLQPVNGGYLIVAAWGDEASDELVVNAIEN